MNPVVKLPDATRRGRASRGKGARGELEVVEILRAAGWPNARRNLGRDIYKSQEARDVIGGPEGVAISVKRSERLRLREAYAEARAYSGLDMPIVVHRCNSQPWLATIELDELLELLALKERG